ncbi:hypothetical protein [Mammaliicoccus sciuri]|uniref:hypothetical protein n=1 Tax=Mammaliicoccus sciuri TaxID=1296 RepID=UPI001C4EB31E|nr:hypothetical protein [Mammaliicoccus sciuri]
MPYKHEETHKQILESYHAYLDDDSGHKEIEEVYAKAKAFDEIRKIEKSCYYVEYDKYKDIDREGFEKLSFIRNTLYVIREWEDK